LIALVVAAAAVGGWLAFGRPPPPLPDSVTIRVRDLPRGAHLFVDGKASASPFTLPGDGAQHRVRLEAPGYSDKGLLFVADSDQTLDGAMNRSR
jgi:hypothetical protein